MQNELTDYEHVQLTQRGDCALHTHDTVLSEHKHIDALQSLEVVTFVATDHVVGYREDIIVAGSDTIDIVITLPKSRGGKKFCVVKGNAPHLVTIQFTGGETMLGSASVTLSALAQVQWVKSIPGGYIPL